MRYIFVEKLHFLVDFSKINDIMLVRGKSHCIYYGYLNVCDDEEHVKLQQGETMDYMYMPYEEFIDFIMSERFIPSEQRRFKLHSEHIVKQIKQACMVQ